MSARWVAAALALAVALPAAAHTTGESFVTLRPAAGEARLELALRDLDDALALDHDGDGRITVGELQRRRADVESHVTERISARTPGGRCPLAIRELALGRSGALVLTAQLGCPPAASLSFESQLFFTRDALHRMLVTLEGGETIVLGADRRRADFVLGAPRTGLATARGFVAEGVLHIWQGLDHVLFLVVLLLPAVLRREAGRWLPAPSLRAALGDVVRVVTAFTVAHSITLALAAAGVVAAAPAVIEPAIAASVVLAAANNLHPLFGEGGQDRRWLVAFALGLLHGFGFSSVLAEIGLPRGQVLAALLGFNLGVEVGQLALVALFVPLAYLARHSRGYRRLGLAGGSALAALVAGIWFCERIFDITIIG